MLAAAPLAAFPFWEASKRASLVGDVAQARRLADEAVRRDPSLAPARQWLAQDALARGKFDEAITHLDWLFAVAPESRGAIAKAIAQLALIPAARPMVERRAASSPAWLQSVVDNLILMKADPGTIFRLTGGINVRSGVAVDDKSTMIRDLISRREYDLAYLAWVSNLPPDAVGSVGYVYDGMFKNLPGLPPFNWNLVDSDVASVDYASGGGVTISYFGNGQAHFLDQTVMLPPGSFRLRIVAGLSSDGEPSKATLTVTCGAGSKAVLASLPIAVSGSPRSAQAIVNVPQDCPIQTLGLDGAPAEYPAPSRIIVKSVVIENEKAPS